MDLVGKIVVAGATSLSLTLGGSSAFAISDCLFSGMNFSSGSISCQAGHQFRCSNGTWEALDATCEAPPAPPPAPGRPSTCSCTEKEVSDCDSSDQNCCVALQDGNCTKRCCPR